MRVTQIITDLDAGGAENALLRLAVAWQRKGVELDVVSLVGHDPTPKPIGSQIAAAGIPVHGLGMSRTHPDPRAAIELARYLRRRKPDLVQTWMYHGDLVGGIASVLARRPVIWNIRHGRLEVGVEQLRTIRVARACAAMSWTVPRAIICCSESSAELHVALGYAPKRIIVIPNGINLSAFQPNPAARVDVRRELGVPEDALLIGHIARNHPAKGHANLAPALARVLASTPNAYVVFVGEGMVDADASGMLAEVPVNRRFLLGRRDDVARLTAALDVAISASPSEGFPNVLAEAMASGVPCVATEVGDSALILGDTGWLVPPRQPDALAAGLLDALAEPANARADRGARARARILEKFELDRIADRYLETYEKAIS